MKDDDDHECSRHPCYLCHARAMAKIMSGQIRLPKLPEGTAPIPFPPRLPRVNLPIRPNSMTEFLDSLSEEQREKFDKIFGKEKVNE